MQKETLDTRSVVTVMSDGYDTDPPEALAVEFKRLKRRAHRLVWLNPLLGWKNYEPVARAMAVAPDYVSVLRRPTRWRAWQRSKGTGAALIEV